ncbi:hypothetical protein NFI96_007274 [Prochilodus magdalenae]|nr:hypothetical protein NFI96_007274 [Prochilodus magdalenae]
MYTDVCAALSLFSVIIVGVLGVTVQQPDFSWTKQKGKRAYIKCKVTGLDDGEYVHWYQQKDGEALKRILYVNKEATSTVRDTDHPEAKDFAVQLENVNEYVLRVNAVKLIHSGVYYCACWEYVSGSHIAVLGVTVEQTELLLTKPAGKSVYIKCKVTDLRTTYVHWYQQKDGEALKRILYVSDAGGVVPDPNYPDAKDFSVRRGSYDLKVQALKTSHSAVYYCACWESSSHSDSYYSHPVQEL